MLLILFMIFERRGFIEVFIGGGKRRVEVRFLRFILGYLEGIDKFLG